MKNKLVKLGTSILLLVTLMLPSTIATAAESEDGWTTLASMDTPRRTFNTEVINGKIYSIGGLEGGNYLASTEMYDPAEDKWTTLASMEIPRTDFRTEKINGKIYAIGGRTSGGPLSSVEMYDPIKDIWTTLSPMNTPRSFLQTEVVNGKIYAFGGDSPGSTKSSSMEVYDPEKDTWTTLASMKKPRSQFQSAVISGNIYAFGLYNDTSVEVYDPINNSWTTVSSMNNIHNTNNIYLQTEVVSNKIYAINGVITSTKSSSMEVYDPEKDTWTTLASMEIPRTKFQTVVVDNKIYVLGGYVDETTFLSTVEVYDPINNSWTTVASMKSPHAYFQVERLGDRIYAIGGKFARSDTSCSGSLETYTPIQIKTTKLKVVLEVNEKLQLSIGNNLNNNTSVTWASSNTSVASVNENGLVTALTTGDSTITVSDGNGYTDSIDILVVDDADTHRLAIDLNIGNSSKLTVDDYTNTATATWTSSDPTVATITNAGRVTAINAGLALITATDEEENQIGQAYVRVRT